MTNATPPKKRSKLYTWVGITVIALAVLSLSASKWFAPSSDFDFNWNSTSSREPIENLGVNGSGLRIAYGYHMDANAEFFKYMNDNTGCTVVINFGSSPFQNDDERQATTELLSSRSAPGVGIVDKAIRYEYRTDEMIPVRATQAVQNPDTGLYTSYIGRVFNQEKKQLLMTFSCQDQATMNTELDNILDGVTLVDGKTTF